MSLTKFASNLFANINEEKENCFFSPFSIQTAMGMCLAGANGETEKALTNLLSLPDNHKTYFAALAKICKNNPDYELQSANALWAQSGLEYHEKFAADIVHYYNGSFYDVDYHNKSATCQQINEWCKENTKGKIPEIINESFLQKEMKLILTNAIYFKGKWRTAFKKENTKDLDFHNEDGNTVKTPTMSLKDKFRYGETDSFQAVELPYEGDDMSMLVVLPGVEKTLGTLEETYNQAVDCVGMLETVILQMPRFKFSTEEKLGQSFKEMGAGIAFSDNADFTGISKNERLKISEVIHKAFVDCNEEGTEAGAATAVGMVRCTAFAPARPPKIFKADRSFLFFIRKNDNILFAGKVARL